MTDESALPTAGSEYPQVTPAHFLLPTIAAFRRQTGK